MKKVLFTLTLALLLTGCAAKEPDTTTPPSSEPPATGVYRENSSLEQATNGAVMVYHSPESLAALGNFGDSLLLLGLKNLYTLSMDGTLSTPIPLSGTPDGANAVISDEGCVYYDRESQAFQVFDKNLALVNQVALPKDAGEFCISPALDRVFYTTGQDLRVLEFSTGESRLLNKQAQRIKPETLLFGGEMIQCRLENGEILFLSAETGELLGRDGAETEVLAAGDYFYLTRTDGIVPERLFGTLGGVTKQINTPVTEPVLLGKYLYSAREGVLYDLEAGREAAALTLPETVRPKYWTIQGDAIWFYDAFAGEICRWDYAQSASFGKDGAVTVRYTAEAPDENGLETCRREAARLNKAYGVNIVFWDELPIFLEDVEFEKEYQIPAIRQALADLDAALARFPEDFLLSLGEKNADGAVNIAIVRSFPNGSESLTVWPEASAWMLLAVGEDLTTEFYKNLSYVLDNYIIAHSLLLDDWNKLNPDGFRYSLSRTPVADAVTEGDNAAFLNPAATTYPRQDRAELFAYAMMAEAGEKLESPALHAKLEALCKAIRDAFGWQDLDITFPWEQPL